MSTGYNRRKKNKNVLIIEKEQEKAGKLNYRYTTIILITLKRKKQNAQKAFHSKASIMLFKYFSLFRISKLKIELQ